MKGKWRWRGKQQAENGRSETQAQMERSQGMTTAFMLAGLGEEWSAVVGVESGFELNRERFVFQKLVVFDGSADVQRGRVS